MKKINNRNVFKFYPHNWKRPSNWWGNIKDFFRSFKFAYQRITKGYCDYDLFSISDWFLEVFPDMIKEFRENTIGYPYDMTEEQWMKYLKEMESHFLNAYVDYEDSSPEAKKEYDELYGEFSTLERFKNSIEHKDKDREKKVKAYYEKVKEHDKYKQEELKKGMDMFQKRFWDLWD